MADQHTVDPGRDQPADEVATTDTVPAPSPAGADAGAGLDALPEVPRDYYATKGELARGGMGRIVDAVDLRAERGVVLKEVREDLLERSGGAATLQRFEREAKITAQLQHPSIVPVYEIGRFGERPFYAMKKVSGKPLDEVIAKSATIQDRLALLPKLLAVTEAIAYAHAQGVIHRDLKPANVLVGAFGETIVIDWGLAKRLDDAELESEDTGGTEDAPASLQTQAGAVMGTPYYMPPEQAVGEPVDARADVYALGAMLYHVLSGRAPLSDRGFKTQQEILVELISEGAAPIDAGPDVPGDLLSIVRRAMEHDPEARYADASELAGELRRFLDGQLVGAHHYSLRELVRRWIKRNRTTVTIATIAVVLLAGVGIVSIQRIRSERSIAQKKRAEADRHRAETQALMDFLLFEVHKRLEPVGQLKLLGLVSERVAEHYAQRDNEAADPATRLRHVLALRRLGNVRRAQGDLAAARTVYERALAILSNSTRSPSDDARAELARLHNALGQVDRAQGKLEAALARHRAARRHAAELTDKADSSADAKLLLAETDDFIGSILRWKGNLDAALTHHRRALRAREAVVKRAKASTAALLALSRSHQKLGDVLRRQGKLAAALARYQTGLQLRERAKTASANNKAQRELAILVEKIGDILEWQGKSQRALALFRRSRRIRATLVARDPTNPIYRRDMSFAHVKIGRLLLKRGDTDGARKQQQAALAIRSQLVAQDPSNSRWQRDLGWSEQYLGRVHERSGDLAAAAKHYANAARIRQALVDKDSTNARWKNDLMEAHVRVGNIHAAQGHKQRATAEYDAAIKLGAQLISIDPSNTMWKRDLSTAHKALGDVLQTTDPRRALATYRRAVSLAERAVSLEPKHVASQRLLARSHEAAADMLARLGQRNDARASYKRSLAAFERLHRLTGNDASAARDRVQRKLTSLGAR